MATKIVLFFYIQTLFPLKPGYTHEKINSHIFSKFIWNLKNCIYNLDSIKNDTTFATSKNKTGIMKVIKISKILKDLKQDGWMLVNYEGSHRQFKHPVKSGQVTVNGKPSDDIWGWLLKSIENQSGLTF